MTAGAPVLLFAQRYRLLEELGRGAAGTVWRAEDSLGNPCAIKIVEGAGGDATLRRRLEREAALLATTEHPSLVRILDSGVDGEDGYLVMELVDGQDLQLVVETGGPLDPGAAVEAITDVLAGLALVHELGVVHRDVKPSNIVLGADGRARLADFGIARLDGNQTGLTSTGTVLGTYAYAAPEQLEDPRSAGPQADVYAAAATLTFLLTTRTPFGLHDPARQDVLLAGLPPHLARAIRRGCAADPRKRPQGALGLARALREPGPAWRKPALAAVLSIGLLAGGLALWPVGPGPDPIVVEVHPTAAPELAHARIAAEDLVMAPAPRESRVEARPLPQPEPEVAAVAEDLPEEPEELVPTVEPPPVAPLRIRINSVPYSELTVDGRPRGRTPKRLELTPGPHRVLLETADGLRHQQDLQVDEHTPDPWCWDFASDQVCGS